MQARTKRLVWRGGAGAIGVFAIAIAVLLMLPAPKRADRYFVIDGDTISVRPGKCLLSRLRLRCLSERLRLFGVDAFERTQTCRDAKGEAWACGDVATQRLQTLVSTPGFGCQVDPEFVDRHAREFAVCTAKGEDVGAVLVSEGLAFAYGRRTRYVAIEEEAKAEHRGAWAGTFVRPQFYRSGARS
ncbi:MAG TPA: thermonuclease family protein [Stellaceae bacterium]|nr:thermonuclease family protein [Stellaceae bacterium]HYC14599.1 thermonuclease family protein [Stellaceae bacterium]